MKSGLFTLLFSIFFTIYPSFSQGDSDYRLENPMTVQYLTKNIRKKSPRLILTPELERNLRKKLKSDTLVMSFYGALRADAEKILTMRLPERIIPDKKRLLGVSREMVRRFSILGIIWRMEKDPVILDRIDKELQAVSNFTDWNPSHYLDVGEMSLAVAIALDWAGNVLPPATVEMAEKALIEKGILPSYQKDYGWIDDDGNWNQVCHGGLVAASLVIAEKDPELAAKTINRALEKMNFALRKYGPDGVYMEGPGYWNYGTSYSVITSSMLLSAFGTDFGITDFPGFMKSFIYRMLMVAPSGELYNYGDNGTNLIDGRGKNNQVMARFNQGEFVNNATWYAMKTGDSDFFDPGYFAAHPDDLRERGRFGVLALFWLSQYKPKIYVPLPVNWKGDGGNPVILFRNGDSDHDMFYMGAKGGRANVNHGNMDAGSFIFELDGVRWSVDPGSQGYAHLELQGFDLWNRDQDSERYTLVTKGSHGHSTLVVNDIPHNVEGYAPVTGFNDGGNGENPEAVIDMTEIFYDNVESARRKFVKESPRSLLIEDIIIQNERTRSVTWQMMTIAEVIPVKGGAILKQEGKELHLEILSPENMNVSLISLDPPPLKQDKQIENLKRIEIRVPAWVLGSSGKIVVRLKGD